VLFGRSSQGIERLEICENEGDKNPRIVTLENCIKVFCESLQALIINVLTKSGQIVFQCSDENELNLWTKNLQSVAFHDKFTAFKRNSIVEYNELYCSSFSEGRFTCTLISTDITLKNKLEPKDYILELTSSEIQLKNYNDDTIVAKWPYRYIRKYGYREGKFTFEAGRKCETGEGTFKLDHPYPQNIFRCMSVKMKSMKKLLSSDGTENQLNVALSMEAGSRSPLPLDISIVSHGFLSSTDSANLSFLQSNSSNSIPNKPPRKTLSIMNSSENKQLCTDHHLECFDSPPEPPERNKSMTKNLDRNYECIEKITEAWRTLGIDEVNHTENITASEDELKEFVWQRSKSFNRNEITKRSLFEIENNVSSSDSSGAINLKNDSSEIQDDYDRLEFFPPKKVTSSGYKTIVPIVSSRKKSSLQSDYEIISAADSSTELKHSLSADSQFIASRPADDNYLGYGRVNNIMKNTHSFSMSQPGTSSNVSITPVMQKQTILLNDDSNSKYSHQKTDYAIVSKPKRV
jgi:docking protein 2